MKGTKGKRVEGREGMEERDRRDRRERWKLVIKDKKQNKWKENGLNLVMLKWIFSRTGNHFVKTGFLPVTGLRDVTCHLSMSLV